MDVYVPNSLVGLTYISLYSSLVFLVTMVVILYSLSQSAKENWRSLQCNPLAILFAPFVGKSTIGTLKSCLKDSLVESSESIVRPYDDFINSYQESSHAMTESLRDISDSMEAHTNEVNAKIEKANSFAGNIGATTQFFGMKIQIVIQKLLAIFLTLLYFGWSLIKGFEAIVKDPHIAKMNQAIEKISTFGANDISNIAKKTGKKLKKVGKKIKKKFK